MLKLKGATRNGWGHRPRLPALACLGARVCQSLVGAPGRPEVPTSAGLLPQARWDTLPEPVPLVPPPELHRHRLELRARAGSPGLAEASTARQQQRRAALLSA